MNTKVLNHSFDLVLNTLI